MAVTVMVVAAAAGVMTAVGRGWQQTESVQLTSSVSTMSALRVQEILRSAKQLGTVHTGSITGYPTQGAAVMMWKGDYNSDGKVQFSELAMLEHQPNIDGTKGTIVYWDVCFPSSWSSSQKSAADSTMADDCMYGTTVIEDFKSMANVRSTTKASGVAGAVFKKIDSSATVRPQFEYRLKFQRSDGTTTLEYGTVTIRTPATMPAGQS